jgi:hypothetical protein
VREKKKNEGMKGIRNKKFSYLYIVLKSGTSASFFIIKKSQADRQTNIVDIYDISISFQGKCA